MKNRNLNTFKKLLLIIIVFLIMSNKQNSFGKELPFLKGVEVKTEVSLDIKKGIYTYNYTITSSTASIGNLVGLDIDISYPKGGIVLSSNGLTIPRGKLQRTFEQSVPSTAEITMIPVGMEKPLGWVAGLTVYGTVTWGGGDYVYIKPGHSLSGFNLNSYGLPGIRDFKAEPSFDVDQYYPSVDNLKSQEEVAALLAKIEEDEGKVSFKGKTIGPTAPPADFKPVDFLNYIISMKHEAFSLGWITNQGIENSLDAKLDNAKKKIEQGNVQAAKNILEAFINEVEAQNGKHLTSEAYALLKYNVQYLIGKL